MSFPYERMGARTHFEKEAIKVIWKWPIEDTQTKLEVVRKEYLESLQVISFFFSLSRRTKTYLDHLT